MGCEASSQKQAPATPTSKKKLEHLLNTHSVGAPILCSAISDDNSLLVIGDEAGRAHTFSTRSTPVEQLTKLSCHKDAVTCCVIHGFHIITGSADTTIIKWSIADAEPVRIFCGHTSKVNRIMCVGRYLFSTSYDKTAKAWSLRPSENSEACSSASSDKDSDDDDASIDPALIHTFTGHTKAVYPIAFVPADNNWSLARQICDRDVIITGSVDCHVRIWSLATGDCLKDLCGHEAPVHCIVIDPNNARQFCTAGGDGNIVVWDVVTGDQLRTLRGHERTVLSLVAHNKMLFSAGTDKTARSWVMEFGEETRVYKGAQSAVTCVEFFDGMLHCASSDGSTRIYDAKSGSVKRAFPADVRGHVHAISTLHAVPGKVITGDLNGQLCVWSTAGLHDDTVFGNTMDEEEEQSDDDCEKVRHAAQVLDRYLRNERGQLLIY